MLVDLGRNDVNRVCEPGSVKVDSLMHVEKYSHVMHIVSNVSGTLREGYNTILYVNIEIKQGMTHSDQYSQPEQSRVRQKSEVG